MKLINVQRYSFTAQLTMYDISRILKYPFKNKNNRITLLEITKA